MLRFLFQFNGTATRKDWWMTMSLSAVLEVLCPWSPLLSVIMALLLVPALAVSARRMRSTGNHAEHSLFSFAGVAALLLLMPNRSEEILATAQPFLVLLSLGRHGNHPQRRVLHLSMEEALGGICSGMTATSDR